MVRGHSAGVGVDVRSEVLRPFIGWDGEGITYPGNVVQDYVLFGASCGRYVMSSSLSTEECFELMLAVKQDHPLAIHVGFAFKYDVNMMLRDFTRNHLWVLYRHGMVNWRKYRIEYKPGKWLTVRKGKTSIRLYDVFGFFQSSFVAACEKFLGTDDPQLVSVREGKQARSSFTFDQLESFIVPYWKSELAMFVRLMDALRDDLLSAGLPIRSWHGPGAVASTVFKKHNIKETKGEFHEAVYAASRYAYAGGRFEQFRVGHHPDRVYEYDINSAYPSIIANLPNLARGRWRPADRFDPRYFGVWQCHYENEQDPVRGATDIGPLFLRDRKGNVAFPPTARSWYWTPEAALINSKFVIAGWVFEPESDVKPFAFVKDYYETRKQWKKQGNSAERALKLALNSLYGKMAQRVGYVEGGQIPIWHQLEWAGYVTSATRAKLYNAICLSPASIVAVETDAVFSCSPLPELSIGSELGQWELTTFNDITYLQSGMYFAHAENGEIVEKYRGFDKGSLEYGDVMNYLRKVEGSLSGTTTRFVGMGTALQTRSPWRSWETTSKQVLLGGGGKRAHYPRLCPECKRGVSLAEGLHTMVIRTAGGKGFPHAIPWIDPDGEVNGNRLLDDMEKW